MLELRACCEGCSRTLPPASTEAMICSFECTFCRDCVTVLENVCPNCGGGFTPRPIRPAHNHKNGNYLGQYPATGRTVTKALDLNSHREFAASLKNIPPENR